MSVVRLSMVLSTRIYQLAGAKRPCGHGSGWVIVNVERGSELVEIPPALASAEHSFRWLDRVSDLKQPLEYPKPQAKDSFSARSVA